MNVKPEKNFRNGTMLQEDAIFIRIQITRKEKTKTSRLSSRDYIVKYHQSIQITRIEKKTPNHGTNFLQFNLLLLPLVRFLLHQSNALQLLLHVLRLHRNRPYQAFRPSRLGHQHLGHLQLDRVS